MQDCDVFTVLKDKLRIAHRMGKNYKFSEDDSAEVDKLLRLQAGTQCLCGREAECRRLYEALIAYLPLPEMPVFGPTWDSKSEPGDWMQGTFHSTKYKLTPVLRY